MANIINYVETETAKNNFYPTPESVAEKLLKGIDWSKIESVLEPSAGKGELAHYCAGKLHCSRYHYSARDENDWRRAIRESDIDCIEIDPALRNILEGNGYRVVHDDFLTYETQKRYHLIAMNPPFDNGAAHLLKALELMERGGIICCILNAETLRNAYTAQRQELVKRLAGYNAQIEYVSGAFADAERATDVEIALVRVEIPAVKVDSTIIEDMRKAPTYKTAAVSPEIAELVQYNVIEEWVNRYNFEAACGIRLIEEYYAMREMLQTDTRDSYGTILDLKLKVGGQSRDAIENNYLRETRGKYWRTIFQQPFIVSKLTGNLQQELYDTVEKLKDYEFSAFNILSLIIKMNGRIIAGIEDTIVGLFDEWTARSYYEDSPNRHYYNGWRTNECWRVGKKVIIPFYGAYDSWDKKFRSYNVIQKFRDIEKVFDFLDSGRTDWIGTLETAFSIAQNTQITRNIDTKYFTVTIYKKGTAHLVFKDMDLLEKFNMFASQRKGWLPPQYGKKHYRDMSDEEKAVIDNFQGAKKYEEVMDRRDYFLSANTQSLLLMAPSA